MVAKHVHRSASEHDRSNIAKAFVTSGLVLKRAQGVYVEDEKGKKYLDMTAGGTTAVGYSHPRLTKALVNQVSRGIDHVDRQTMITEKASELADELKKCVPRSLGKGKAVFGHSGSDIIEKAIRLVRFSKGRPLIVSYYSAHHGANATALSASPTLKEMGTNALARFFSLPGFMHMPFPDSYRPWFGKGSAVGDNCLAFFERLLTSVVSPRLVAGVLVEPILSLGGNIVPPNGYFQGLAKICRENDIPLIDDEVLTGIGKTGRMFAMEHWGVVPDVLCAGKALSGPLPLTMLLAREELADQWEPKDYVGISKDAYILGCVAAIEILRIVRDERLVDNASRVGGHLEGRLRDMVDDLGLDGDVRGKGLMMALDLVESGRTKAPDSQRARKVVQEARRRGLVVGLTGTWENVIRFLPSLTVSERNIDDAIEILVRSFKVSS
jgi:4-aminobutyrate aminotransferase-like enzyme